VLLLQLLLLIVVMKLLDDLDTALCEVLDRLLFLSVEILKSEFLTKGVGLG